MPVGELLASLGDADLVRLSRRLQPSGQMLGRAADLVDLGELAGDHVGNDMAGVETNPDLKPGITKARDAPNQFYRSVAGQGRMIVVRNGGTEHGGKAVAQFLADDTAELPNRPPHSGQSWLQARDRLLRIELCNKPGGIDDIGPENCDKPSFTVGIGAAHACTAIGAAAVACFDRRLTCRAKHSVLSRPCSGTVGRPLRTMATGSPMKTRLATGHAMHPRQSAPRNGC